MNTALWIMQGILAALFIMPGFMKVITSKQKMIDQKQLKTEDSTLPIRALGFLELLGCVGIIAPWLTGIVPVLTPITAVCFAVVMLGAFVVHYKKKDYKVFPVLTIGLALSVIVACYRF